MKTYITNQTYITSKLDGKATKIFSSARQLWNTTAKRKGWGLFSFFRIHIQPDHHQPHTPNAGRNVSTSPDCSGTPPQSGKVGVWFSTTENKIHQPNQHHLQTRWQSHQHIHHTSKRWVKPTSPDYSGAPTQSGKFSYSRKRTAHVTKRITDTRYYTNQ